LGDFLRDRSKNGNKLSRTDKCDETQKDSSIFLFVMRSKAEFFNKKEAKKRERKEVKYSNRKSAKWN
jgi:hypothetical protein